MVGYAPELVYAIGACHYKLKDFAAALKVIAEIIELGVRKHPELGIGSQSEGIEVILVEKVHVILQSLVHHAVREQTAMLSLSSNIKGATLFFDFKDVLTLHRCAVLATATS